MALLSTNNIKTGVGTELTLTAMANESFMIKDVMVEGAPGAYATVFIDTSTQGFFRTDSTLLGNHLPFVLRNSKMNTILSVLAKRGLFTGYPIPSGSRFTVRNTASVRTAIVYDRYDPGDIKNDMKNGRDAKSVIYLHYGQPATAVSTATEVPITVRVNPAEFPDFPFRAEVPTKKQMVVHGIIFSARAETADPIANWIATSFLRMMKGRDLLFDPDRLGLLAWGVPPGTVNTFLAETGHSISGENSHLYQADPLFFDKPLVFNEGEELDTYWTTRVGGAGATFSPRELEIAYIIEEISL